MTEGVATEVLDSMRSGDEAAIANVLAERRQKQAAEAAKPAEPAKEQAVEKEPESATDQPADGEKPEAKGPEVDPEKTAEEAKSDTETPEDDKPEPKYKVVVDGKEEEVALSDLRKGYMQERDYTRKTQALAEQRNAFQTEATQFVQIRDNTLNELAVLSKQLVESLTGDEASLDQLRQSDPAEYAARMADRVRKQDLLRRALQAANGIRQQDEQRRKQHETAQRDSVRKEEDAKLIMQVPEWADSAKREKGRAEVKSYLQTMGYTTAELDDLTDHRAIILSRKAQAYDRLMAARKTAETAKVETAKVKPAGKAPAERSDSNSAVVEAAQRKLSRSGSLEDAAQLMALKRKQSLRR